MHIPVMLDEVLNYGAPTKGEAVIDCTFGRGGYSKAFLEKGCYVTALDRDPSAQDAAKILSDAYPKHFNLIETEFSKIADHFPPQSADIILFDIGVSSPQLDEAQRGFSFNKEGPLDMRMGDTGRTAADIINNMAESELADIFYNYGEERASRKYARLICERRDVQPFETTSDLADFIKSKSRPAPKGRKKIHPATLIFQALRIAVNDELGEFKTALEACKSLLKPGGRLVMVTFHSLEDRIAKQFSKIYSFVPKVSKYADDSEKVENIFQSLTKKVVSASREEALVNPRASSAKLRALKRTTFNG